MGSGVTIVAGNGEMNVNNNVVKIRNGDCVLVSAYLREEHGRIFVPMNALSIAFNIEYRWDVFQNDMLYNFLCI